jgi:hypothetical protein
MRSETKSKLDRMLFMRRLQWGAAGVAVLAAVGAVLYVSGLDATVVDKRVAGVVENVGAYNGTNSMGIMNGQAVDVRLDDGRQVHVLVLKTSHPTVGERVEVTEHHHGTGRTTYSWK